MSAIEFALIVTPFFRFSLFCPPAATIFFKIALVGAGYLVCLSLSRVRGTIKPEGKSSQGMSRVTFSRHAVKQIAERGISRARILQALAAPDHIRAQDDNVVEAVKQITRKSKTYLLVVVYRKTPSSLRVITAFVTSKVSKYLSR